MGKSQSVKEKNNPSVPSEAGGLAGLIQQQLYNVFLPFKRLHQCTTVYSLCKHLININVNGAFTKRDKVTWAVLGLTQAKDKVEQRQHLKAKGKQGLLESHEISRMFRFRCHMLGSLGKGGRNWLCVEQNYK